MCLSFCKKREKESEIERTFECQAFFLSAQAYMLQTYEPHDAGELWEINQMVYKIREYTMTIQTDLTVQSSAYSEMTRMTLWQSVVPDGY